MLCIFKLLYQNNKARKHNIYITKSPILETVQHPFRSPTPASITAKRKSVLTELLSCF